MRLSWNERAGLGFALQVRLRQLLDDLFAAAAERGLIEDSLYADALAELRIRTETLRLLAWKGLTDVERYGQPGPEGSLLKWLWSDTNQRLTELAADILGPEALTADSSWSYELLRARGNTIEGGTTEILKNIVAERVLGLPRFVAAAWRRMSTMDFGLTGDQKDIQRTGPRAARRACQARPGPRARGGRKDRRRAVARDRAARLAGGRSGRGGDMASALRGAAGVPGVIPGVVAADVIVVIDDGAARIVEGASEPVATIDPTRPVARVTGAVGEELTRDVQAALDRAAVAVAAELVCVCDRALAMTVAYVTERKQFGTPVGVFQVVSHRAAEMLLATEKARAAVAFASWAADAEPGRLAEAASIAKAAASIADPEVTAGARPLHGGVGCTREADVHWLSKRAHLDAQLLGDAKQHRARLAKLVAQRTAAVSA